ncbi:hypothetical protein CTA1_4298 [Colletotrichum tanaceti]|uniref:Uncharacterized protein n=1 Tax=Colletotrichum tanaceti TaxID=1306861 RepID=A0A4U6XCP4_9PEZI|nr:hypothetical protein CTA1_4298 [Colletotrichum tanaceti]
MARPRIFGIIFTLLISTFILFASAESTLANIWSRFGRQSPVDSDVPKKPWLRSVRSLENLDCTVKPTKHPYYKVTHQNTENKFDFVMEAKAIDATKELTIKGVQEGDPPPPFETREAFLALWQYAAKTGFENLLSFTYLGVNDPDTIEAIREVEQSLNPGCTDEGMCTVTLEDPKHFNILLNRTLPADDVKMIPYDFEGFERHYLASFDWGNTSHITNKNFWFRINLELAD